MASLKQQPAGRKALSDISNVEASVGWKKKNTSKASLKQQPAGMKAGRKALSDISNAEASVGWKKKNTSKASLKQQPAGRKVGKLGVVAEVAEEFNVADEGYLHNHQECIRLRAMDMEGEMRMNELLQMLSGDRATLETPPASFRKEIGLDSIPEPPEIPVFDFSDLARWNSRPYSPIDRDSPPYSPIEFVLKEENEFVDVEWPEPVEFVLEGE